MAPVSTKKERILVIMTDELASFVAAEPVFENIRAGHPNATISLLTTRELERLARSAPYFDQVAASPQMSEKAPRQNLINQVKKTRFSRIYDLSAGDVSRRLQAGLGFFKPKWIAIQGARGQRALKSGFNSAGDLEKFCAACDFDVPDRYPSMLWALETRKDSANMQPSWYGLNGPYGLLLVNRHERRRLPVEHYIELANLMSDQGITPVLIGDHGLHEFGDRIAVDAPEIVDLTGKSDHLQLASLARNANFFVSDHADEMYLALSVGCNGVLVSPHDDPEIVKSGCHVVRLAVSPQQADQLSPQQVWQTVCNMGLAEVLSDQQYIAGEDQSRIRSYA